MKPIKFSVLGCGTYTFDPKDLDEGEELSRFVLMRNDPGCIDILPMITKNGRQYPKELLNKSISEFKN